MRRTTTDTVVSPSDSELDSDADIPTASAAFAFVLSFFGLFGVVALLAALFIGSGKDATLVSATQPVAVTLSEFAIRPSVVSAVNGAGLDVTNKGNLQHNLAVEGTTAATPMLDPGKTAHLDLSTLPPGDYTIVCQVPGHKATGMTATLHLTAGQGETAAAASDASMPGMDTSSSSMTPEQMDKAMKDSISAFPAKTDGLGAQLLADGARRRHQAVRPHHRRHGLGGLPGKKVKAMTYNGTVPGPTIKVIDGDKVAVVLHNQLPESTSIHFHGLDLPNAMDGTTDITQDPVKTGETFTYTFVAHGPAVGMYHSHHDAVRQVPDGLAGAFLIGDEPLPAGVSVTQEQVMILDDSGTIGYALNGKSFPATAPIVANQGDWIEVHYMNEGTQIHPMHLHGMPQMVIAKDGYPLTNPSLEDTVTVAPGERYTVLVHATNPGTWVWHCHILPTPRTTKACSAWSRLWLSNREPSLSYR